MNADCLLVAPFASICWALKCPPDRSHRRSCTARQTELGHVGTRCDPIHQTASRAIPVSNRELAVSPDPNVAPKTIASEQISLRIVPPQPIRRYARTRLLGLSNRLRFRRPVSRSAPLSPETEKFPFPMQRAWCHNVGTLKALAVMCKLNPGQALYVDGQARRRCGENRHANRPAVY